MEMIFSAAMEATQTPTPPRSVRTFTVSSQLFSVVGSQTTAIVDF